MAGRISGEQSAWIKPLLQQCADLGAEYNERMVKVIGGAVFGLVQQQIQQLPALGAGAGAGIGKRGTTTTRKRTGGKTGSKTRSRKLGVLGNGEHITAGE